MSNYGTYGLSSCSGNQSGREPSSQGSGHWFGSTTSRPRCYEPSSYGSYASSGGFGGCGSCGGGYGGSGRMGSHSGFGSFASFGGCGGQGSYGGWGNPRPCASSPWGSGWGN